MNNFIKSILLLTATLNMAMAQINASDTTQKNPFKLNPKSVVIKSILLPGAGQISQERLWTATLFYGVSITYYSKSLFAYNDYLNSSAEKDLNTCYDNLKIAGLAHIINVLDAYYFAYVKDVSGWDGTMFSDKPLKSPWGATVRSLMIPGWGQWYNESYLKAGAYVSAVILCANEIYKNKSQLDKQGKTKIEIRNYKDDYSRYSWYLGFTYLLMLIDAHVDAHLFKFDEAVRLSVLAQNNRPLLSLSINF